MKRTFFCETHSFPTVQQTRIQGTALPAAAADIYKHNAIDIDR